MTDARPFHFKHFSLFHHRSTMKVGTDAILLGCWVEVKPDDVVLDIGTGCGLLPLMLSQKGVSQVDAVDIDAASIEEATINFEASRWRDHLRDICADINDFLPEHIASVTVRPNELVSPVLDDKKPVLDILAVTEDGRKIIIEMQQERRKAFFPRLYYYGSKLLAGQLKKGSRYQNLLPVIVLCFTNFTTKHAGCPKGQLVYEYQHREKVGGGLFTGLHTTYICELPRLAKKALDSMNPIETWFYILRNCHNFAEKPAGIDSRYDHVLEAAKTNLVPDMERTQYFRAMLSEYDKQDIGEAYYEEGRADEKLEIAQSMKAKGFGVATIVELTGLSAEEIEAL
ncbi:MAG: Rpn family recombination-promoting nuclease/putative transposase [Bacteroidales bacterium]|nr:Rpn family recombination-promoting nuclease/putative transposase [Bacteroidales bacterium]